MHLIYRMNFRDLREIPNQSLVDFRDSTRFRDFLKNVPDQLHFLESLFSTLPIPFQIYDKNGYCIFVNDAFFSYYGRIPPKEYCLFDDTVFESGGHLPLLRKAFSGETVVLPSIWYDASKLKNVKIENPKRRGIQVTAVPIFDSNNNVLFVVISNRDVTAELELQSERDKLNEELERGRRLQSQFATLFGSSLIGMLMTDTNGEVVDANDTFLRMLGYTRSDFESGAINWLTLTPDEHREASYQALRNILRTGASQSLEKEYIRKDGARIPVLIGVTLLPSGKARFLTFVIDLTDRNALQAKVLQAQRLEAVGRIAAAVSHDFNNVMAVITMNSEVILDSSKKQEQKESAAEQIQKAAQKASLLTRQLLTFSNKNVNEAKIFDITNTVKGLGLERFANNKVSVEVGSESDGRVRSDPSQVEQVVMNLANNSIDAMPDGGKLNVDVYRKCLTETLMCAGSNELQPGEYVCISVRDTGTGIPQDLQTKIFEPFVTTKPEHLGAGLGLPVVLAIAKQWSGGVTFQSSKSGSNFEVLFPIQKVPETLTQKNQASTSLKCKILLCEDQVDLRKITAQALRNRGHTVIEASDGNEGLKLYIENKGSFDLIISDVIMPDLDGPEMVKEIKKLKHQSKIRVLYISGYSDNRLEDLSDDIQYLEKPYTPKTLYQRVDAMLAGLTARKSA